MRISDWSSDVCSSDLAGGRPQVVWPNGVLASTATGLMVQALTPWHSKPLESVCLEYDGNKHTVSTSAKMSVLRSRECPHYPTNQVGDHSFAVRIPWTPPAAERTQPEIGKASCRERVCKTE